MPKKVMDLSDQGVPEERMEGNVRVAPTSTSNPSNVEGGTNLQSAQGAPPLTPQTHGLMEGVVQAEGEVHIANLPWAGATSYPSASPPPESSFFTPDELSTLFNESFGPETSNALQNPCAPSPSQNRQLLDNTLNESQGSILLASDTQLTPTATIYTPRQSNQSHQSFHRQGGHGTGVSPPRESMDIEPLFPSEPSNEPLISELFDSPPQIPGDIIDTMNPSTSEGVPPSIPQTRTDQRVQEDRPVDIASLLLDGATSSSSASPQLNSFPPDSPNELLPNISQSLTLDAQQNRTAPLPSQNRPLLTNTSQNESQGSILPGPIESNTQLTNMATTNAPQHSNQTHQSFHRQCGCGTGLSPPRDSMDIEPPIPSQSGPPNSPPQIPEDIINTTGPSTSEAPAPPQHQSVPHQAPNNAPSPPRIPRCGTGWIGPLSSPELDMNKGAPLTSHTNTDNFEKSAALNRKLKRLYSREHDIRNELEYGASLSLKKPRMEATNWLAAVGKLRNDFPCTEAASEDCLPPYQRVVMVTQEVEDLMRYGNFPNGLFEAMETTVSKLLEGKMVGEAFQRNITKILECLAENQVSRLGIYGMGGVGKTTTMVHIHNILIEKANYDNVLWVTVSQDFNTQKLQEDIWKKLKLGTPQEKDVRQGAAMLSDCLTKIGKSIIILDDVWEYFNLEEMGIPVGANGIKLVLTTRSYDVCRQMLCQENIKIEPLSHKEAKSLFLEELRSKVDLNLETEEVMDSIVKECEGLPLGLITMARSMRGVTDVFEWRDSLVKLKESSMVQTYMEKVLMNLKFSDDRLCNPDAQQCFLLCALYPEDEFIDKFKLIEFFIDQGLIDGLNTRKEQYDRGLTILSKLGNICLLEDHGHNMKMHDLIRDMALHIMSTTSIVKARKRLRRIPPEEYWTDALEKVSLTRNKISEFPLNLSPNCPKLSTLLLDNGLHDAFIPNSFFKNLFGLKVLNLSGHNMTELPNSILDLVNLRALLLRHCTQLCRIPYLGKLTSLRKLDAENCWSLEVLEGLEKLANLRYLDLTKTSIERLPKGTLDHLLNLQYLKVLVVNEEDITKLGALETFGCSLENVDDFNKCVRAIEQSNNPRYYNLDVYLGRPESFVEASDDTRFGNFRNLGRRVYICDWGHAIVSVEGECTGIFILIPRDVQKMTMSMCNGITNLSNIGPFEYLEELDIEYCENIGVLCGEQDEEVIDIHDSLARTLMPQLFTRLSVLKIKRCSKLKYLFGDGSKYNLPHLRSIEINGCEEMVGIIAVVTSPPPHLLPFFPSLESIFVLCCDKMKRAVESEWMPHLPTLRSILVVKCEKMEEIIGGPPPYLQVEEISLEFLEVRDCDNMRKLISHEWLLHLRNLQSIEISGCKGMVEMISGAGQGQEGSITTHVNNTPSSFQPYSISLPKLKWLELCRLPQLKSVCEVPISCDSMKELTVSKCPELKRIPLQLRLCEIEELPHIWVEDEEKWKTLMWDHSNAQAILQRYLRKGEHAINLFRGRARVLQTQ